MKKILVFFISMMQAVFCHAQDTIEDPEQKNLEIEYQFTKYLDQPIASAVHLQLFSVIYDWIGTPYKYSGKCRQGIDCSAFVNEVYKSVYHISLPNNSASIYKNAKALKIKEADTGDLLFFKIRKNRISHVGIYIGNNKFAHASTKNGVIISDLDEPYYRKYFYKAGRIIPEAAMN